MKKTKSKSKEKKTGGMVLIAREGLNFKSLPISNGGSHRSIADASHWERQTGNKNEMEMIERILEAGNLTKACKEVVKNKGAGGIDKMPVRKLKAYLDANRSNLCDFVRSGGYLPQPIRGKQIS